MRWLKHISPGSSKAAAVDQPPFEVATIRSYNEWVDYSAKMQDTFHTRRVTEAALSASAKPFKVNGYCWVCKAHRQFTVDYLYPELVDGKLVPNWREQLVCERCGLSNRLRASIHLFESMFTVKPSSSIYITEQLTPIYRHLKKTYSNVVGSEFLGSAVPHGYIRDDGLRNEDLTSLSFDSNVVDFMLSFDCFEHIPDFNGVFAECFRVLKPDGRMIYSVPFDINSESNLIRARIMDDDSIEHLLPPEYHGNPTDPKGGSLCFQYFGWEMLQQLKSNGFSDVYSILVWSHQYAYLGQLQIFFVASI